VTRDDTVVFSDTTVAICVFLILLVPVAAAGLSLISTGLNRSRSAAHGMLMSLCVCSVAILVYFASGFSWQGFSGGPAHVVNAGGKAWNWLGAGPLFLRGFEFSDSPRSLTLLLQMFSVALASIIPAASGAERWRIGASCASTALFAGWTYPVFAHWVCGGGWLAGLGLNFGIGRGFVDPGGASFIHVVGGLTALSVAWLLGPRRGKFAPDGLPAAMPGHNAVIVLFGCLLALIGWFGLNSAGAILFVGMQPARSILIAVNTSLSAASGAMAAMVITRVRFGKPDASLTANGWVSGLVASSAACAFVKPAEAVIIGMVAGGLVIFAIEVVELRMGVDDPAGAISVHAAGGIWGVLAVGIFGQFPNQVANRASSGLPVNGDSGQFLAQLVGVATLIGFVLPLTYSLNWLLDRCLRQRVSLEAERQGIDLFELGAGAYPDFVTHREDLRH
jgi:Amt family ammonium transporter